MFTGIIEEVGRVRSIDLGSPLESLIVEASIVAGDLREGDSIAVNGVCLTVTRRDAGLFAAGVVPETLRRTNLGSLDSEGQVNLERPLQAQSRLGGHFVQGHVDGTGSVRAVAEDGDALDVRIEASSSMLRYIVEKGFIAVDGASLTVTRIDDAGFHISLIPYSQQHLAPGIRTVGSRVNLEVDILAKYLEKLLVH